MTENARSANCPVCHKEESIQRIPAIVSSGRVSGTFSGPSGGVTHSGKEWGTYGGYTTLSGSQQSDLARLLAPPEKPKKPLIFPKSDLIISYVFWGLGCLLIIPIPVVLLGLFYHSTQEPIIGNRNKELAKHEQRLAEWESAKEYWSSLYYCHRDGIVFDPVSLNTCQPEDVKDFVLLRHPIKWNYAKKFYFRIPIDES